MPREIGATGNAAADWAEDRTHLLVPAHHPDDAEYLVQGLERILGRAKALDEAVRRRMESLFCCDLSHVRVHDSVEAIYLAQRLGGEAFTIQGHIFGSGEKLNVLTPQAGGLLAHEITHVVQQTQPPLLIQGNWPRRTLVPQANRPTPQPGNQRGCASEPTAMSQNEISRPPLPQSGIGFSSSQAVIGQSASRVALQATGSVVHQATETEAQASEQAVRRTLETEGITGGESFTAASAVKLEEIAAKVYQLMFHDLILERERGAALT